MTREIIKGVLYDTKAAKHLFKYETGSSYTSKWTDVYQTNAGTYFAVDGWFGCAGQQSIRLIDSDTVLVLLGRTGNVALYETLSGQKVVVS